MPLEYVVLHQGTFVYTRAHGILTDDDLILHEQELAADPHVAPGFRQIIDCRWVADDRVTEALVPRLTRLHAKVVDKIRGARYAIIAHSDQWFEVGTLYRGDPFHITLIVFNEPSTACIWLGVDLNTLRIHHADREPTPPLVRHMSHELAPIGLFP